MVMRYFVLLLITISCNTTQSKPQIGECFIGPQMEVRKLLRMDQGKYLFANYPYDESSPAEIMEDVSALKKVDCPL